MYETVRLLREQRMGMVQTPEQYGFIHQVWHWTLTSVLANMVKQEFQLIGVRFDVPCSLKSPAGLG